VNVPVTTADASDVSGNNLVAGDGTTAWDGTSGYTYYYLASDLFHEATSGTLQSGKAYLKVANGGGARQLSIVFGDDEETTGIENLTPALSEGEGVVYNLRGQRVAQPAKGLYIVNGKKVVIK
jgi:phage gp45-like